MQAGNFDLYQHYKGATYLKICEALHADTAEPMVIYASSTTGQVFCRAKAVFEEQVTISGSQIPRFRQLKIKESTS